VIENQFGRSDHDHFGKAMTYLAAHEAKTVVWIAESFADEHRAALTWLNDNTPEDISFYGVAPKLMRIAGSPPGLRFDIVIAPNTFVKRKKEERKIDETVPALRESFWSAFNEKLAANESLNDCRLRYGGRLGFEWIIPPIGDDWLQDEPHVLVFIARLKGRQTTGVGLYCRNNARPEAEERLQRAIEHVQAGGIALGSLPADLSNPISIAAAATELLERVKPAYDAIRDIFSSDYDTLPMYGR